MCSKLVRSLVGFVHNLLIIRNDLIWIAVLFFKQVDLMLKLIDDVLDFFFDFVKSFLRCVLEFRSISGYLNLLSLGFRG